MSQIDFLLFTGVAAVALGYSLLWIVTQFLRTDSDSEVMDEVIRRSVEEVERSGASLQPETANKNVQGAKPARIAEVNAMARKLVLVHQGEELSDDVKALAAEEADIERQETVLARMLLLWGTISTVAGGIIGVVLFKLVGALIGAVAGSIIGTVFVVGMVLYRSRVAANASAQPSGQSKELPDVAEERQVG